MSRPRTVAKAYEMQRRMISLYRSDRGGTAWRYCSSFPVFFSSNPYVVATYVRLEWQNGCFPFRWIGVASLLTLKADRADLDISSSSSLVNGRVAADGEPPRQEIENEKCRRAITEERATRGRRRSSDGGRQLRVLRCGGGGRALSVALVASTVVMAHLPVVVVRVLCEILGRSR
ncbi:hypothetical protein NL676_008460 [Syzygium grande]|nr:hypothetical protein NL676_008460 [Syzygium grande]